MEDLAADKKEVAINMATSFLAFFSAIYTNL